MGSNSEFSPRAESNEPILMQVTASVEQESIDVDARTPVSKKRSMRPKFALAESASARMLTLHHERFSLVYRSMVIAQMHGHP
jgi:hypothetical protein